MMSREILLGRVPPSASAMWVGIRRLYGPGNGVGFKLAGVGGKAEDWIDGEFSGDFITGAL